MSRSALPRITDAGAAGAHRAVLHAHPGLPGPAPLHVLDPDASLRIEDGHLVVDRPATVGVRLRLNDLLLLSIHGTAAVTTPTVTTLLKAGIPIVWRSPGGHYIGQSSDLSGGSARHRRAQYAAQGSALGTAIAARLVAAKIGNMRVLLRRRGDAAAAARLQALARAAAAETDLDRLRGIEGAAAAEHFAVLPALLSRPTPDGRPFLRRTRRPPGDAANALLSYVAAVVTGECAVALLAAGLDVTEGFLHGTRAGRPALALDLIEPFRPPLVEATVLALLNTGEIGAADFSAEAAGPRLTDGGRRTVLLALERRMAATAAGAGGPRSWRAAIVAAARSLAAALAQADAGRLVLPTQR